MRILILTTAWILILMGAAAHYNHKPTFTPSQLFTMEYDGPDCGTRNDEQCQLNSEFQADAIEGAQE